MQKDDRMNTAAAPRVSIVVPSFNSELYITKAIGSILNQTYQNYEILIVDDGSTDNSLKIVEELRLRSNSKLRILTHPNHTNRGLRASYQLAIRQSESDFVAFLEQDDCWAPDNLKEKLDVLIKMDAVGLVYSDVEPFGELASEFQFAVQKVNGMIPSSRPINLRREFFRLNPVITMSTAVIRRNLLIEIPAAQGFDSQFDWLLFAKIAQQALMFRIPKSLTYWNVRSDSYHHQSVLKQTSFRKAVYNFRFFFELSRVSLTACKSKIVLMPAILIRFLELIIETIPFGPQFKIRLKKFKKMIKGKTEKS